MIDRIYCDIVRSFGIPSATMMDVLIDHIISYPKIPYDIFGGPYVSDPQLNGIAEKCDLMRLFVIHDICHMACFISVCIGCGYVLPYDWLVV